MTFRLEEKVILLNNNVVDLKNWLEANNYKIIYPKRKINSLYFDNYTHDMYNDSEEGCVPRKKIRIRNYPKLKKNQHSLEIKISSIEGRFKTIRKIKSDEYYKFIKFGYFDDYYGLSIPTTFIEYDREYYSNKFFRITIDTKINYKSFKSSIKFTDNYNVMEFKSNNLNLKNWVYEKIPFPKVRFSKYCRSYFFIV